MLRYYSYCALILATIFYVHPVLAIDNTGTYDAYFSNAAKKAPTHIETHDLARLKGVLIEGATAYNTDDLKVFYTDYLGAPIDIELLKKITSLITLHYRADGYVLSKAILPEQEIDDGIVRISVIEGHIERVDIDDQAGEDGADWFQIIPAYIDQIQNMKPLHGPTLERTLLIMSDLGDVDVSSVVHQIEDASIGGVGLSIKIKDKNNDVRFGMNNHGSRFTGPIQGSITARFGTGLIAFDEMTVQILSSVPMEEMQLAQVGYNIPFLNSGFHLNVGGSYSNSAPGHNLSELDIDADSYSFNVGVSYPFWRSKRESLTVSGGFEGRNISTDLLNAELYKDRVRNLSLEIDYERYDYWHGQTNMSLIIEQGLEILGARETGALNSSRTEGRSDFLKANMSAQRLQSLGHAWQWLVSIDGQYANAPLLSSEEYGFGGVSYGRAYDTSEIVGDKGVSALSEVRYNHFLERYGLYIQGYAFYDVGKVWNIDQADFYQISAASAGSGVRFSHDSGLSGGLGVAVPLTKKIETPLYGNGKNPRFLFNLSYGL